MDLLGQRFGRLVVTSPAPRSVDGYVTWACSCDCGATAIIKTRSLRRGSTRSCGCLRADANRARNRARAA